MQVSLPGNNAFVKVEKNQGGFNKTYYLEFTLNINYFNRSIAKVTDTNFLRLVTDDTL